MTTRYIVGVDCGGTFTDCVLIDDEGRVLADKAFTTPEDLTAGIVQAIRYASEPTGLALDEVLRRTRVLAIGTTSLTNRLVSRKGAAVGLLTTKGHEDAMLIGRVLAKTEGLRDTEKRDLITWDKPEPIVPRSRIHGVTERVDYKGAVLVQLDEAEALGAVDALVAEGVESIAVSFLWSFVNPAHERAVRKLVAERHPGLFVSLSSDIAPVMGEYERTATTVLNAYLGPPAIRDLGSMRERLAQAGFTHPFFLMQSNGGLIWSEEAVARGVNLLASGPVGGAMAAVLIGKLVGAPNVILADVGGTSFDVGLVVDGAARFVHGAVYDRFRCVVPTVGIESIGTGGGSIARVNPATRALRVGPESAGSRPGPVCYAAGGTEPTVTDADLVLGRLSPSTFFAGRKRLDLERARRAIEEKVGRPLGFDAVRAAKGIVDIADAQMADLIRKLTVERGHDPRDFALMAYGGAGPAHVGACARELGIRRVIVPSLSSVFSAFGIASSDVRLFRSLSQPMRPPFAIERLRAVFAELEAAAAADIERGVLEGTPAFSRFVEMRFRNQIHEVSVPVGDDLARADGAERIVERFFDLYERTFGAGTAYRDAVVELLTFRLLGEMPITRPSLPATPLGDAAVPASARSGTRAVFWDEGWVDTPVFDGDALRGGNRIAGPAVIDARTSTVLVHPGQEAALDGYRNVVLSDA